MDKRGGVCEPTCSKCGKKMRHTPQWVGCVHWSCPKCHTQNWPANCQPDDLCPKCGIINSVGWVVHDFSGGPKTEGMKCMRCGAVKTMKLPKPILTTTKIAAAFTLRHSKCEAVSQLPNAKSNESADTKTKRLQAAIEAGERDWESRVSREGA